MPDWAFKAAEIKSPSLAKSGLHFKATAEVPKTGFEVVGAE